MSHTLLKALIEIRDELSKANLNDCERQAWNAYAIAVDAVRSAEKPAGTVYTLRRCKGSVTCWSATVGEHDFNCGTNYNLGALIESLWEQSRKHGDDAPAFILATDAESEDAAMIERRKRDRQNMVDEIGRHQREIRYCKRRLAELPEWQAVESEAA